MRGEGKGEKPGGKDKDKGEWEAKDKEHHEKRDLFGPCSKFTIAALTGLVSVATAHF